MKPTLSLLCLSLFVWPPVYAGLEYLILALVLVLELVLELARLLLVEFHGPISIFDGV